MTRVFHTEHLASQFDLPEGNSLASDTLRRLEREGKPQMGKLVAQIDLLLFFLAENRPFASPTCGIEVSFLPSWAYQDRIQQYHPKKIRRRLSQLLEKAQNHVKKSPKLHDTPLSSSSSGFPVLFSGEN